MTRGGRGRPSRAPGTARPPRPPGAPAAASAARARPFPRAGLVVALACVALALWVQRRALGGFFALDDLVIIEEVVGLREAAPRLWRFLSRTVYFGAAVPWFGSNPLPYHLVSVGLHAANVALLFVFVRARSGSVLAAGVAAGLFGASRLHFSALGAAATIGEPLALALTLGALLLHARGRRARVAAPVLFLGAVLAKESVVLLPAVLLLPRPDGAPLPARLRQALPLLALAAAATIGLLASAAGGAHLGGEAYARGYGGNLFLNLMTYTRWVVDPRDAFPGQVSAMDPGAWPIGVMATLGLVALVVVARRAALPPAFGASWWLLALLPVLPLLHHSYLYYLYIPMAGVVMVPAGVLGLVERIARDRAAGARRGDPRRASPATAQIAVHLVRLLAILVVLVHAARADWMLDVRYAARMPGTGVPLDPDLRKSEIARHAAAGVGQRLGGRRARVAFLLPSSLRQIYSTATGERLTQTVPDSSSYTMLAGSLDDGRGLRALLPNVDSVVFLPGWMPGYGDFEIFSQSSSGEVFALGPGAEGYAEAGSALIRSGDVGTARDLLAGAITEFPDHASIRYQYARSLYAAGDSLGMQRELAELVRRTPDHPLAERVRAILAPGAGGR